MQAPITIDFGNRNRELRFDIAAVLDIEATLNKTIREVMVDLSTLSFTALVVTLWAGLKRGDSNLTLSLTQKYLKTYETLPGADVRSLFQSVTNAMRQSQWYQQVTAEEQEPEGKADGAA